jgi:general secretion pathway protein H
LKLRTHSPTRSLAHSQDRRAFTLIELLLVLGLVALAAAWAAPAWRGQLAYARLESAAKELRTLWQETRLRAVEEATDYRFDVVPGTGYWRVLPVELAPDYANRQRAEGFIPSAPAGRRSAGSIDNATQAARLPEGVRFVAPWSQGATADPKESDDADGTSSGDDIPGESEWVRWIVFEPSGRASDAQVFLEATEIQSRRRLIVRGLTSRVTIEPAPYPESETDAR